jgi:hypothetical protein
LILRYFSVRIKTAFNLTRKTQRSCSVSCKLTTLRRLIRKLQQARLSDNPTRSDSVLAQGLRKLTCWRAHVLSEIQCFFSGLRKSAFANLPRLNQDAFCHSALKALECDKTRIAKNWLNGRHRLHSSAALSASCLARPMHGRPPDRLLSNAPRISEPISGRMTTDAKANSGRNAGWQT